MREKWVTVWGLTAVLAAAGVLAPATAAAQPAEAGWVVPRTPDGRADLQGRVGQQQHHPAPASPRPGRTGRP